jgi:hypothetical protein
MPVRSKLYLENGFAEKHSACVMFDREPAFSGREYDERRRRSFYNNIFEKKNRNCKESG